LCVMWAQWGASTMGGSGRRAKSTRNVRGRSRPRASAVTTVTACPGVHVAAAAPATEKKKTTHKSDHFRVPTTAPSPPRRAVMFGTMKLNVHSGLSLCVCIPHLYRPSRDGQIFE